MTPFTLNVPATTANLGAGYDLIGTALGLYNRFHFSPSESLEITASGPFGQNVDFPMDQDNLVYKAFAYACKKLGKPVPTVSIQLDINIPPSRGLGSSSTAIVAGVSAAYYWYYQTLDKTRILPWVIELEGHPDNVAPALLGGCQLNHLTDEGPLSTSISVPDGLKWVVCYPEFQLSTSKARAVLPDALSQAECIQQLGYFSALLTGLITGNSTLIAHGLNDCLHQPFRAPLVPGLTSVIEAAKAAGALGAVLSGAGPSVLALTLENPQTIAQKMQQTWNSFEIRSDYVIEAVDTKGVHIL